MPFGLPILGRRHISLNGIYLPANLAVQQARRSCVPLHASRDNPAWPVRNMGSGVLYTYRGRQFCVFTRHQLGRDILPSQLYVRLTPGSHALHGGARFIKSPRPHPGLEEHDLCLLEMPWTVGRTVEGPMFFQATPPTSMEDIDVEIYFAVGYPSTLAKMAMSEDDFRNEHVNLSQVLVWATSLTLRPNDLPMLSLLPGEVMVPKCAGNFDGFSGGPVFGISRRTESLTLRGIIIRGGHDKLFFASTEWAQRLCDVALTEPEVERIAA